MLQDLEVLTPSLVVCAAFLIAIVMFLRRQMSPKRPDQEEGPADIPDATRNATPGDAPGPATPDRMKH